MARPGRIRIEPIPDYTRDTLHGFIRRNVEPGSLLVTDGNTSYRGLKEYHHQEFVIGSMVAHHLLHWSHRVISLLKRWGMGTYHGVRRRYVRRYLDEFVWRFNRRRSRPATFHKLLGLAVTVPPAPLPAIRADPLDRADQIVMPPAPPPGKMPTGMLASLNKRQFKKRRLLPPEDYDDEK